MKFFVSYSRSVKEEVRKVVDLLEASGHEVWWDADIPVMADWWASILKNIEWCEVFIFVTSEKSVQSAYCLAELKYANDKQRPIIPFVVDVMPPEKLPKELPPRGQWLVYEGDPSQMLRLINIACENLDEEQYKNLDIPRPPEPLTGGKSVARQYQEARQLANDGKLEEAKAIFSNIKRIDYGQWGDDCDEWLERIASYLPIIELSADASTLKRAGLAWAKHSKEYGKDFDPYEIEQALLVEGNLNLQVYWLVGGLLGLLLLGIGIAGLYFKSLDNNDANPTTELAQVSSLDPNDVRATGAANAYATLTALVPTNTPMSEADIQSTATAEFFGAATNAVLTETTIAQVTQNAAIATEMREIELILSATATSSATFTPTPSPTPDSLETALRLASTPMNSNAQWEALYPDGFVWESEGVKMVLVPAGCFIIGSADGDADERNGEQICFNTAFWIDQTEVSQAQFEAFGGVAERGSNFAGDNRPVEQITWYEARTYCEERRGISLPTEAQWEYAARGIDGLIYPWGNDFVAENAIWNRSDSQGTAEVGSIPAGASWVGALDLSGNVWEWTSNPYPYGTASENSNSTDVRILRGGSWVNSLTYGLISAGRFNYYPSVGESFIGFRCAFALSPES